MSLGAASTEFPRPDARPPRVWAIPGDEPWDALAVPPAIEPLSVQTLLERSTVNKFRDEWQPLGKTAYINTDASWRDGVAGLAYESGAIGRRVEFVECTGALAAEYLALLMAMGDAAACLHCPVVFRVDSQAVADLRVGRTIEVVEPRDRITLLLADHPQWAISLIKRTRNKLADRLSRRPFMRIERSEWDSREISLTRAPA